MTNSETGQRLKFVGPDFWISSPVTCHVTLNFGTMVLIHHAMTYDLRMGLIFTNIVYNFTY